MNINSDFRYTLSRAIYVPLALVVQVTLAPAISIFGIQPSILLAVFTLFAFKSGALAAIWMGFGCGVVLDTYAAGSPGAFSLALAVVGFLVGQLHERRVHISHPLRVTILGIAMVLHDGIWHLVSHHGMDALGAFLLRTTLPSALYTMTLGAILFAFRPPRIQARSW